MEKKTPLYEEHLACQGKIVPFGGYLLPVEYPTGVITEHMAVREACGLFDVSHMGEIILRGPGALKSLNHLMTNDYTNLAIGRVRYSPMCNKDGGVVDDLIVYRMAEDVFFIVVNAANCEKDDAHMRANLLADTQMENISVQVAQIALQGPKSKEILQKLIPAAQIPEKYYSFTREVSLDGIRCLLSRTGYTGSLGYELYCAAEEGPALWKLLLKTGKDEGLIPCGLGARDTLRLEAGMPLYGHEMDDTVSPLETDLAFSVKMNKAEFIGKDALAAKGTPQRKRVGLKVTGRGIVREHQAVFAGGKQIGMTTSGTFCPYLKGAYAMALVDADAASMGSTVEVDVRGRKVAAEVVAYPFYQV